MRKFKVIFFLLICITWAFDCHGRLETAKHNEVQSSSIFEQKCSNCHEANKSRMLLKDEKAWEETLFRMSKKQGAHITRSDVEKLVSMHVESLKKAQELFEKKCLNCHKRMNIRSP
jgi:cytochrome c5